MKTVVSEKRIETTLTNAVKALGGWAIKLPATFVTGLPDRLCLFPGGKMLFVELKSPGKVPTKIQEIVHAKIRKLGFTVLVIDNLEDAKAIKP
jgi:hypothetical protein